MKKSIFIALAVLALSCHGDAKCLVIGHRGAMGYETENTLASVQKAIDLGADVVEIDVFKCGSGEAVVFHDENVERLTNGAGSIEELSIVQVKSLILDGGHRIPLLQDVLKLANHQCKINIDLQGEGTADRVAHILQYYIDKKGWKPEDFIVSSPRETELRDFYARNPTIPIGVFTKDDPLTVVPLAQAVKAVSIHTYYQKLTWETVKTLQKKGYKVYAGVVNEPADIQKMKDWGVNGIVTDFPDRAR